MSVLRRAWPLLLSVALLMVGMGLQGSLVGLRAPAEGFSAAIVGIVLASYYGGYVLGATWGPKLIKQVGHVRAFTGLASLASVAMLLHGFALSPIPWIGFRLVTGLCLSGLFVVAESWLSATGTLNTRGTLLAAYMLVVTSSLAAGQFLLQSADIAGPTLFVVTSVLVSLSVVPMSLARQPTPPVVEPSAYSLRRVIHDAPLSLVAATAAGMGVGSLLGFGAVEASTLGFDLGGVALFVAAVPAGSALMQLPLGRWSDRTDRRRVMVAVAVFGTVAALMGSAFTASASLGVYVVIAALLGGSVFPLYSLSLAHLTDYIDDEHVVAAGARMILLNGLGAAAAPMLAAPLVDRFGPKSFFLILALALGSVAVYGAYRLTRRDKAPQQTPFAPVPHNVTVSAVDFELTEDDAEGDETI